MLNCPHCNNKISRFKYFKNLITLKNTNLYKCEKCNNYSKLNKISFLFSFFSLLIFTFTSIAILLTINKFSYNEYAYSLVSVLFSIFLISFFFYKFEKVDKNSIKNNSLGERYYINKYRKKETSSIFIVFSYIFIFILIFIISLYNIYLFDNFHGMFGVLIASFFTIIIISDIFEDKIKLITNVIKFKALLFLLFLIFIVYRIFTIDISLSFYQFYFLEFNMYIQLIVISVLVLYLSFLEIKYVKQCITNFSIIIQIFIICCIVTISVSLYKTDLDSYIDNLYNYEKGIDNSIPQLTFNYQKYILSKMVKNLNKNSENYNEMSADFFRKTPYLLKKLGLEIGLNPNVMMEDSPYYFPWGNLVDDEIKDFKKTMNLYEKYGFDFSMKNKEGLNIVDFIFLNLSRYNDYSLFNEWFKEKQLKPTKKGISLLLNQFTINDLIERKFDFNIIKNIKKLIQMINNNYYFTQEEQNTIQKLLNNNKINKAMSFIGNIILYFEQNPRYSRYKDIMYDYKNNIMWQDNKDLEKYSLPYVTEKNYNKGNLFNYKGKTVVNYCKNLKINGIKKWRVPTYEELLLLNKSDSNSFIKPSSILKYNNKGIYWSSTSSDIGDNIQIGFNVENNEQSLILKDYKLGKIRCIKTIF